MWKPKKNLLLQKWAISITYYYLVFFNSFILEQSIVFTLYTYNLRKNTAEKNPTYITERRIYI